MVGSEYVDILLIYGCGSISTVLATEADKKQASEFHQGYQEL